MKKFKRPVSKLDYDKCRAEEHEVIVRVIQVLPQTYSSPAEYEEIDFCTVCESDEEPERDWDIERDLRDGF